MHNVSEKTRNEEIAHKPIIRSCFFALILLANLVKWSKPINFLLARFLKS